MRTYIAIAFLCAIWHVAQCAHLYHQKKQGKMNSILDQLENYVKDMKRSMNDGGHEKTQGDYIHYKLHDGKNIQVKKENHLYISTHDQLRRDTMENDENSIDMRCNSGNSGSKKCGEEMVHFAGQHTRKRGISDAVYKWPANALVWDFAEDYPAEFRSKVETHMNNFNQFVQCDKYKWTRKTAAHGNKYFVRVQYGKGCRSYLGYLGDYQQFQSAGYQFLELGDKCLNHPGIVYHEMLHAMGFSHEQSRADRDDYVKINMENVMSGFQHNFDKDNAFHKDFTKQAYDYASVMQYSRRAFSFNGKDTIDAIDSNKALNEANTAKLGQREHLTQSDQQELNHFYSCDEPSSGSGSSGSGSTSGSGSSSGSGTGHIITDCNHDGENRCKIMDGCQASTSQGSFMQVTEPCHNCKCESSVTAWSSTHTFCYVLSCSGPASALFTLPHGQAPITCSSGEHYFAITISGADKLEAHIKFVESQSASAITNVQVYDIPCNQISL